MVRGVHLYKKACAIRKRRTKLEMMAARRRQQENEQLINEMAMDNESANEEQNDFSNDEQNELNVEQEECVQNNDSAEEIPDLAEENPIFFTRSICELYSESRLSKLDTIQLLQLYRARHCLSDCAFEQLLNLLSTLILPQDNKLPRTLYSFNKFLIEESPLQILFKNSNFIVYDIARQIKHIFLENLKSIIKYRNLIMNNYDFCGDLMRNNIEQYISLALITDGGALAKSTKLNVWPIAAQLLDLPPVLQKKISNVIYLAIFVGENVPNWNEIFQQILPQTEQLGTKGLDLGFATLKIRFLELLADNKARAQILMIKEPPAYYACPHCTIKGKYQERQLIYPHEITPSPKRTNWMPVPDALELGNGIKELTPLVHLMDLPTNIQIDVMHTVYGGSIQRLICKICERKAGFDFFKSLIPPKFYFNNPAEIIRNCVNQKRNFGDLYRFKTSEFRSLAHYILPVALPHLSDVGSNYFDQAVNLLVLCAAMSIFASKNLTNSKITFANRLLMFWHKTINIAFDDGDLTYKAHLHLHLAECAKKFGSPTSRTCFFLESIVGYLINRVTCTGAALKQIDERIRCLPGKELLEIRELFSTKRFVDTSFQFTTNSLDTIYKEYLSSKFPNAILKCAKQIKLQYMEIRSRVMYSTDRDSIIYIYSAQDHSLKPAIALLIFKEEQSDQIYMLVKCIKIVSTFSRSLSWVKGQTAYDLLTDNRCFPDTYVVQNQFGMLGHVPFERIATKGLKVIYKDDEYEEHVIFPLNTFDHD